MGIFQIQADALPLFFGDPVEKFSQPIHSWGIIKNPLFSVNHLISNRLIFFSLHPLGRRIHKSREEMSLGNFVAQEQLFEWVNHIESRKFAPILLGRCL